MQHQSSADRRDVHPEVAAGDPFIAAGRDLDCRICFGGFVTVTVEEDGVERDEAVPCRRCQAQPSDE